LSDHGRRLRALREAVLRCLREHDARCIRRAPTLVVREDREVLADVLALADLAVHDPALALALALVDHVRGEPADFCLRELLGKLLLVRQDARHLVAAATSVTRRVKRAR
jgi:hypothetical protein